MPRPLADVEQTRNRLEILNQFFRGMLLLNGGGCVALLAFLQAIWNSTSFSVARGILVGMALFIAGLTFTASGQYLRYEISKAIQFEKSYGRALQTAYFWLVVLSGLAFVIGASVIVIALWGFAEQLPLRAPS